MLRPTAIGFAQTRRPRKHRFAKLNTSRITKSPQNLLGILLSISGVDNRWHRSGILAHPIKHLRLLDKPKIFQRRVALLLNVRQNHLARIANKKAIRHTDKPFSVDFRQEMMRHLFLIKNVEGPFVPRLWNRSLGL